MAILARGGGRQRERGLGPVPMWKSRYKGLAPGGQTGCGDLGLAIVSQATESHCSPPVRERASVREVRIGGLRHGPAPAGNACSSVFHLVLLLLSCVAMQNFLNFCKTPFPLCEVVTEIAALQHGCEG